MVFYPQASPPHQTPFLDAVLRDNFDIANYFLKMQPEVINCCNGSGETALHVARTSTIAELLLSKKIRSHRRSVMWTVNNVLHLAVLRNDWQLVRFYLELTSIIVWQNQNNQPIASERLCIIQNILLFIFWIACLRLLMSIAMATHLFAYGCDRLWR